MRDEETQPGILFRWGTIDGALDCKPGKKENCGGFRNDKAVTSFVPFTFALSSLPRIGNQQLRTERNHTGFGKDKVCETFRISDYLYMKIPFLLERQVKDKLTRRLAHHDIYPVYRDI